MGEVMGEDKYRNATDFELQLRMEQCQLRLEEINAQQKIWISEYEIARNEYEKRQ